MGLRLSIDQVAAYCGVRRKTVANWIRAGKLPTVAARGAAPCVRQDDFVTFLEERGKPIPVDFIEDNKYRVLVVDDDPEVVRTLGEMLGTFRRFLVKTALDGLEAGLRLATFRPHLVILDIMMPRLDGYSVCSHIKADPGTTGMLVLAITGDGSEQTVEKILACGADGYLVKPVRLSQLQREIGQLLNDCHLWPVRPSAAQPATC